MLPPPLLLLLPALVDAGTLGAPVVVVLVPAVLELLAAAELALISALPTVELGAGPDWSPLSAGGELFWPVLAPLAGSLAVSLEVLSLESPAAAAVVELSPVAGFWLLAPLSRASRGLNVTRWVANRPPGFVVGAIMELDSADEDCCCCCCCWPVAAAAAIGPLVVLLVVPPLVAVAVVVVVVVLVRDLAMKLLPNLARLADTGLGASIEFELELADELCTPGPPSSTGPELELGLELGAAAKPPPPKRRRPANSCLLDLRVVELAGRLVVVELVPNTCGAIVVLLLPVACCGLARDALKRVWKRLLRLPNLRLVDAAEESELSVLLDPAAS